MKQQFGFVCFFLIAFAIGVSVKGQAPCPDLVVDRDVVIDFTGASPIVTGMPGLDGFVRLNKADRRPINGAPF